jgi:hypothetical protein
MTFPCWKCGETIQLAAGNRIGSRDTCPRCDADLHSCRNCDFYDPSKNNQCSEPQAEWVRDKEAANYCDYYRPCAKARGVAPGPSKADAAKKRFDSLFKA